MAEIGAVTAIIQVAEIGVRLSTTLFTFAETVAKADTAVSTVSREISLTSAVLNELADILNKDSGPRAYSASAVESAVSVVNECAIVFAGFENIFIKKVPKLSSRGKSKGSVVLERFKWPYLQPRIGLLQSNLDRLKSSLLVILNVIHLARTMRTEPASVDKEQTALVRDLIKSNQEYAQKYDALKSSIMNVPVANTPTANAEQLLLAANPHDSIPATRIPFTKPGPRPTGNHDPEHETQIKNLEHFVVLFGRLQQEVSDQSYRIGSHSRSRIEKQILDIRSAETKYLYTVHGAGVDFDLGRFERQWSALYGTTQPNPKAHPDNSTAPGHLDHCTLLSEDLQPLICTKPSKSQRVLAHWVDEPVAKATHGLDLDDKLSGKTTDDKEKIIGKKNEILEKDVEMFGEEPKPFAKRRATIGLAKPKVAQDMILDEDTDVIVRVETAPNEAEDKSNEASQAVEAAAGDQSELEPLLPEPRPLDRDTSDSCAVTETNKSPNFMPGDAFSETNTEEESGLAAFKMAREMSDSGKDDASESNFDNLLYPHVCYCGKGYKIFSALREHKIYCQQYQLWGYALPSSISDDDEDGIQKLAFAAPPPLRSRAERTPELHCGPPLNSIPEMRDSSYMSWDSPKDKALEALVQEWTPLE